MPACPARRTLFDICRPARHTRARSSRHGYLLTVPSIPSRSSSRCTWNRRASDGRTDFDACSSWTRRRTSPSKRSCAVETFRSSPPRDMPRGPSPHDVGDALRQRARRWRDTEKCECRQRDSVRGRFRSESDSSESDAQVRTQGSLRVSIWYAHSYCTQSWVQKE